MSKNKFKLNNYIIEYNDDIQVETFKEKSYYGIIFKINQKKYQLIHNYDMKTERLIINCDKIGSSECHDIPFKPATFHLLPEGVSAQEL